MKEPERPRTTREDLERAILREVPHLTAAEVAGDTPDELAHAKRMWRALGFPEAGPDEAAFTKSDKWALARLRSAVANDIIDGDTATNLTRALGQTMARLADWEVSTLVPFLERIENGPKATGSRLTSALQLIDDVNQPFEDLMIYAWRRHLAAAVARVEALGAADEELKSWEVTVGFADIVAFSALSNELGEERTGDLVEVFESRCADVIAAHGGRLIKSLGDSVLFVSEEAESAFEIAEGIITVIGRDARMPDVRLGMASGHVVMRMGDVFGPPVNLAARMTAVARRNRLIIDDTTAELLPAQRFDTRRLPPRPIRGFGIVEPIAVRRH